MVYLHLHKRHLCPVDLLQLRRIEPVRTIRWGPLGCAIAHRDPIGQSLGRRLAHGRHGSRLGGRLDQHDSTFLGLALVGHRGIKTPRHHGLLRHSPHHIGHITVLLVFGVLAFFRIIFQRFPAICFTHE